ncbi:MAG TPA: VCBS repeat-containing protein [Kofleriaceae bacterium]|nr:VCBS repeat-containing protein [Kofleriaceae bacterium]
MLRHAYLVSLALAACTDVATITPNVCGNYVLDPGEDCDQPTGCTASCRIQCDPTMATTCSGSGAFDGTCCPSDMACGADRVCHAPTGTVETSEPVQTFDAQSFQTADIDGDLIDDVLGVGATSTEVLYGDLATPLSRTFTIGSPAVAQNATPTFGDITGDGKLDILLPTNNGLFAFDDASGEPQPIAFPAQVTAGITHERIALLLNLGALADAIVEYDYVPNATAGQSKFQLTEIVPQAVGSNTFKVLDAQPSLCGIPATNLNENTAVRGRAIHPVLDGVTLRLPLVLNAAGAGICVATVNPSTVGADASYSIPKSIWGAYSAETGDGETFFANLVSTNGCPDLVVPASDSMNNDFSMILVGTGTANSCRVDVVSTPQFVPGKPLAAINLAQPVAGTTTALVTSAGIFTSFTTGAMATIMSPRPWHYAALADLDHDGRQDLVTVGTDTDVEVLYQRASLNILGKIYYQFDDVVIPTQNTVVKVAIGNYDGDLSDDVAIATTDPTVPNGPADLSIAWGNLDSTFTVTDIGSFDEPYDFMEVNLLDTSLPAGFDQNDDLIIARGGLDTTSTSDPAAFVEEYGSTSRTMNAPYVYTLPSSGRGVGAGAVAGHFGPSGAAGLFALFMPATQTTVGLGNPVALTAATVELSETGVDDFTIAGQGAPPMCGEYMGTDDSLCPSRAHLMTMHSTAGELVLAVRSDQTPEATPQDDCMDYYVAGTSVPNLLSTISCAALAPAASTSTDPNAMAAFAALTTSLPGVFDDDGTTEHIRLTTVAVTGEQHSQHSFGWSLTVNSANQPQLDSPIAYDAELGSSGALPSGSVVACVDGVELELGTRSANGKTYGDGAAELLFACSIGSASGSYDTQLWARYVDPGGGMPLYQKLWDLGADVTIRTLRAGDINGDGLADVLFTYGAFGTGKEQLHVLLQCDAHQTDCQGGGS